ncbi:MAG: hypothetical protein FIB01_08835 [Gemmatimonadetes bacterium]|nr:hypothetical protein [Gemmatimonadota bacterium]
MMDPRMLSMMVFTLLAIIIAGGFVLLMPLSRQLARYLAYRMQDKAGVGEGVEAELRRLRAAVEGLDQKLHLVDERQEFLEKVLASRETDLPKLPR